MRCWLEVDRPDYWPETDRLELSDSSDAARAAYDLARQTWNGGETVVVRVGEVDPLVLRVYAADEVTDIRFVDTWEPPA